MKKLLLLISLLCMGTTLSAQESDQAETQQQIDSLNQVLREMSARMDDVELDSNNQTIWKDRAKYFNIGYVKQKMSPDIEGPDALGLDAEIKSKFGISLSWGKTYYLHKKPLARMIKIGLDWSWLDINYANYSPESSAGEFGQEESGSTMHQAEIGMSFGPSVTVNPIHQLKVSGYFRFTPSYSGLYADESFYHHYATFFNTGFSVAWKVISIGCEWRWGTATYDGLAFDEESLSNDEDASGEILSDLGKQKFKTKSMRVYLGFRF